MNPETLPRAELAGLHVEVVESPNADLVGVAGRVVDETTNTLLVAAGSGTTMVPKSAATFRFHVDDTRVVVEGWRLVARPARRTEQTGDTIWR
ncbi:ribonuclease P protein component 1 [Natronomonas sp. EA1]|uniref:ribonuclease P protein component 1 n=1 Tax=Natronomonas sp. EA1 TaxID=3421655 RepID=UPI003EBCDCE8